MAGVTAQGGTFAFSTFSGKATSIQVEMPAAEIVDMTSTAVTPAAQMILVPTGGRVGGSVSVDFIANAPQQGAANYPDALVGSCDNLTFTSPGFAVSRRAIMESASVSASTGDIVRGTLKFRLTDYMGS